MKGIQTHGTGFDNQLWVESGKAKILLTFNKNDVRVLFIDDSQNRNKKLKVNAEERNIIVIGD